MLNPQTPVRGHKKKESTLLILIIIVVLAIAGPVITREDFRVDRGILDQAERKYGKGARTVLIAWEDLIRQDKSSSDRQKLEKVNQFFNRMQFVDDFRHWGQKDYWATPIEFLASGGGDCEDFAIFKFFSLRYLGFSPDSIRIVVLVDTNLKTPHAVLTVDMNNDVLVLDNQTNEIISHRKLSHYVPVYSVNEKGWWIHTPR